MSTHQPGDAHAQTLTRLRGLLASAEESARAGRAAGAVEVDEPGRSDRPHETRRVRDRSLSRRAASSGARTTRDVPTVTDVSGGPDSLPPPQTEKTSTTRPVAEAPEMITDESTAHDIALRRLSVRARSGAELRRDLRARHVEGSTIDAVLARLEHVGLVDDTGFARQWVEERQRRQGLSTARLRQELARKGVAADTIRQVLDDTAEPQFEIAMEFAQKRARSMVGLDGTTMTRRLSGQLARRGFPESVVRRVVMTVVDGQETS